MIFVVGKVSADFRAYLVKHTISYGLFGMVGKLPAGKPEITYGLDFTSSESIIDSLSQLNPQPEVSSIIVTGYEHYVLPAAIIARYFGVASMSAEAATAATDKLIMREKFTRYDATISPDYAEVQRWQDIATFIEGHSFPVMLKPANLMKSLFITKNDTLEELQANYNQMVTALPAVYEQYHLGKPRIVIETCMAGSMHTVAGFVDADGQLTVVAHAADCITARDIGRRDNYLYERRLPTQLHPATEASLFAVARAGTTALGLRSTPVHVELILTPTGPKIIEIGARLGGYRPRMYGSSYGLDLYAAALACAEGKPVTLTETTSQTSSVLELFPEYGGILKEVTNLDACRALPSVVTCTLKAVYGQRVGSATDGYKAVVIVNLCGQAAQVSADESYIRQNVSVRV